LRCFSRKTNCSEISIKIYRTLVTPSPYCVAAASGAHRARPRSRQGRQQLPKSCP
jgi:hypothetical protein